MALDALTPTSLPEDVLALALRLRDHLDYKAVVALCDPASLVSWLAEYREAVRPPTKEDLRHQLPHLTDDKLDQVLVVRLAHFSRYSAVPRGTTYAELSALAPEDFAHWWLENNDIRCQFLRRLRLRGQPLPAWDVAAVPYHFGVPERISARDVRVSYWYGPAPSRDVDPQTIEYEELRQDASGGWRLVAREGLLQPRGSMIYELPPEFFELYGEE